MSVLQKLTGTRIAALCSGILLPLAFAPFDLWWLSVASVAAIFWLWEGRAPKEAAVLGAFYGVGAFSLGTYWLYISLRQLGGAPIPIVAIMMSAMVLAMACFYAFVGWASSRLSPSPGIYRWVFVLPAIWVLTEWVRSWIFTGFPWLSLGYGFTGTPFSVWAPVMGVFGVSLVCALFAGLLVCGLRGDQRARLVSISGAVLLSLITLLFQNIDWTRSLDRELKVSLIQAAVPQEEKWRPSRLVPTLEFYRNETLALERQDLVVWPEAAIPALPYEVEWFLEEMNNAMRARGTQLFSGILTFDIDTGEFRNTLMGIGEFRGEYYKRHLVPFGEYFPVPDFVSNWLRLMNLPSEDITAGGENQSPLMVGDIAIAPTVCYEVAFGAEQLDFFPQSGLMINVSNDTWFGDSIAPHQHLQMARMRSIETGRPMLRATNTGVTALIDADGTVLKRIPQFVPGVLSGTIRPRSGATPYVVAGDWPLVLIGVLMLIPGLYRLWASRDA